MSKQKLKLAAMIAIFLVACGAMPGLAASVSPGKFYLVSTGPGDPKYLTLQAIEVIQKADLVLSHPESAKKLAKYLQGKKVEDPWKDLWMHQGKIWMKDLHTYKPEERPAVIAEKSRQRDEYVKNLKVMLAQGKNIVLLDGGDPTVYSRGFWLLEGLSDDQFEIVPGVGAMTASFAALKRASTGAGARFVAQTTPYAFFGKQDRDDLARDLSRYPGTLVFYMGISELSNLVETLKKYNPPDLPIGVVYYAGYPEKEKVVKGTLSDIMAKLADEKERWLGMIVVGRCLSGPHFVLSE
ncbi:MAG TPA: tetrapyrrole methylase [Desulfobacterales bacterium]|nr:tetrapyrrole methylase [Desulfobacterales bacterium]